MQAADGQGNAAHQHHLAALRRQRQVCILLPPGSTRGKADASAVFTGQQRALA
jgi:hypothetical protein